MQLTHNEVVLELRSVNPGCKVFYNGHFYFSLGSLLTKPEYMRMPMKLMPEEIVNKYNLKKIEHDGWVYVKISKGMYGVSQVGKIAIEMLQKRLARFGYHSVNFTPGLWTHV